MVPANRSKIKSADRDFAREADFWFSERVIFFFREYFAVPVSSSFVPEFDDLSLVNQNNN